MRMNTGMGSRSARRSWIVVLAAAVGLVLTPARFTPSTAVAAAPSAPTASAGGSQLYTAHDASGRVTVTVFRNTSSDAREIWTDQEITVGDDAMVAIGGGATAVEYPAGALLTASYPNDSRTGWIVSAKDHAIKQEYQLTTYVIGLKIAGMTRDELKNYLVYHDEGRAYGSTPSAASHLDSNTDVLLGGGFRTFWNGWGQLATGSYPSGPVEWTASSKDHLHASPGTVQSWAIGIKRNLPVGTIDPYVSRPAASQRSNHPSSTARVEPGFVMTGGGGRVASDGQGCALWSLDPSIDNSGYQTFSVRAKDHAEPGTGITWAWTMGIRLV
ncbi:hypothetical protein EKH77_02635 [Streptomyces luteoverticillatus]|uniref:Uncharacterized protein n=1 Tax=Streptomyces luteoverticillatus TaxID=66425 RepID=A0A3S9PD06_STRLT|nr:hypothetical protein [Streptomyces luteoverticillatus]AZQ70256.1 hypothetical protein EKH77_02635 [Streptomyces luteoverticillatus]